MTWMLRPELKAAAQSLLSSVPAFLLPFLSFLFFEATSQSVAQVGLRLLLTLPLELLSAGIADMSPTPNSHEF